MHPIPASHIRRRTREILDSYDLPLHVNVDYRRYAMELMWGPALEELRVPFAHCWNELPDTEPQGEPIPGNLLWQLVGQKVGCGLTVVHQDQAYLVVDTFSELGAIGSVITQPPRPLTLYLVDPDYIDLGS